MCDLGSRKSLSLIPKTHPGGADSIGRAEVCAVVHLAERSHLPRRPLHLFRQPTQGPRHRAQTGGGGAVQSVGLVPPPHLWRMCQGGDMLATALSGVKSAESAKISTPAAPRFNLSSVSSAQS